MNFRERLEQLDSATFSTLRPLQQSVLQQYAECHLDTADLAIEMPTGSGKTLIALLIADYALEQGRSVAYLTGTRQLADHVCYEAELLGLPVVQFSGGKYGAKNLLDYHTAETPAVMNYWVYFNARPKPRPADLVLFDDAHLAEQPLAGLDTVQIHRETGSDSLYDAICDIVLAHSTVYRAIQSMRDGLAESTAPPDLISFNHWTEIAPQVGATIEASSWAQSTDGRFVWPKLRDQLTKCCLIVGPRSVEIQPYRLLTTLNEWYRDATQRIYLSATLGAMDDLQRRLGTDTITRLEYGTDEEDDGTGDRCLVLNPTMKEPFDSEVLDWVFEQLEAADNKAAWLCASISEADELEEHLEEAGYETYRLHSGNDSALDDWIDAECGNLLTAGRYDGLDLTEDVCRLVIVTSVPRASSEMERFVAAYIGDAEFLQQRVGQRITQALGRANRTPDDYALYLGLDPRFAHVLADPRVQATVSEEVKPAIVYALELHGEGLVGASRACRSFWDGEDDVVSERSSPGRGRVRPGRRADGSTRTMSADHEIEAATELWLGSHARSARAAQRASSQLMDAGQLEHAAFWKYIEAHAYFDETSRRGLEAARLALLAAIDGGPRTSWFRRLERLALELAGQDIPVDVSERLFITWDEWIRDFGIEKSYSQIDVAKRYLHGTHDQQCDALLVLAKLSGASGRRPPRTNQAATDCLWSWPTRRREQRRVWEVKTEDIDAVPRSHVNQLLGQIEEERGMALRSRVKGCLVTTATRVKKEAAAAARDSTTIVHRDALMKLLDLLTDRFRRYGDAWGSGDAESRSAARSMVEELLPSGGWLQQLLKPSQGKIVLPEDVDSLFPRAD